MATSKHLALLQISARCPGAAVSPAVDFLIPGLEGHHFVAYGCAQGSVVVACARQVGGPPARRAPALGEGAEHCDCVPS